MENNDESQKMISELGTNFYEIEINFKENKIICQWKRTRIGPTNRVATDKYFIDVIEEFSKKYGFLYEYRSNYAWIAFELTEPVDLINGKS